MFPFEYRAEMYLTSHKTVKLSAGGFRSFRDDPFSRPSSRPWSMPNSVLAGVSGKLHVIG